MGRTNHKRGNKQRKGGHQAAALARPMQGMDQKSFRLNDIVPIILNNPTNSQVLVVTIQADVNGYTYQVVSAGGSVLQTVSRPYGGQTGQFDTQALFYDQYYISSVQFDLNLTQGGAVCAVSPMVTQVNPNGASPFVFTPGGVELVTQLSSAQNVSIHNPYSQNRMVLNYERWLMAMSDRCWRQTRDQTLAGQREFYPSDGSGNEFFKLPSLVKVFTLTIPEGTFDAGTFTPFVLGFLEFRANYKFAQRRTDINDLVAGIVQVKVDTARQDEREKIRQRLAVASTGEEGIVPIEIKCVETADSNRSG